MVALVCFEGDSHPQNLHAMIMVLGSPPPNQSHHGASERLIAEEFQTGALCFYKRQHQLSHERLRV